MSSKLVIRIRKRSQPGWLVYLLVVMPFLLGTLCELLGAPGEIRYILDIAWVMLVLYWQRAKRIDANRKNWEFSLWICLFVSYTLLTYMVLYQSPLYYLWGIRNNFRYYAAFFAFTAFLEVRDIEDFLHFFDVAFWINAAVSIIQYFGFELQGDYLGGIFSTQSGGNGYTNVFFVIVLAKSVVFCMEKKERIWMCFLKCVAAIAVAALAELKFFFVELMLIIVLATLFTNFSWRKLWIIVGGIFTLIIGSSLLAVAFPKSADSLSLEWFLKTATSDSGYTSSGDMNRLNAIAVANELFLKNGWMRLFGLGLGNCDTSSFAFLNTPFFETYGDLHYTWLSYAMMYLECGWIGLIFYFGFFALVYFKVRKIEQSCSLTTKTYCRIARIMALMCMVISVYNSSLRTEAGYMAYFVLAIPFVIDKEKTKTVLG